VGSSFATKNGEFFVSDLGYFVDYYEPNLNIVIEYDEPKHYNVDNSLKKKDLIRMNEIKSKLKCKFYRYNEKLKELKEY
jgi:very-short-patch-repair endonuclease